METLIVHPTATASWQALVHEAETLSSIKLNEELESYLVFLLMRFSEHPEIIQSILAIEFLESLKKIKRLHYDSLRDVGDKCLLLAGLFPGNARRRRVKISYYVKLGQSAYGSLSYSCLSSMNSFSKLFSDLSDQFVGIMDVLHTMRELTSNQSVLDLLQAEELWQDTQSKHALLTLRKKTDGFIVPHPSPTKDNEDREILH